MVVNIQDEFGNSGDFIDSIRVGQTLELLANTSYPVEQYLWTASDSSLSCTDCQLTTLTGTNTQAYTVEVIDANGCTATDRVLILVRKSQNVYIPNAFSPNDDGINDIFTIEDGGDVLNVRKFQVFNRWGELMYDRTNIDPSQTQLDRGWDGKHRGELMNTGVYVYQIEIEFVDGVVKLFAGDVLLRR